MKLHVRKIKSSSGNTCVQVTSRPNRRTKVIKHIGTAKSDQELSILIKEANKFIEDYLGLQPLFAEDDTSKLLDRVVANKIYHLYAYEFLKGIYDLIGYGHLENDLIRDLVIIRIIEPVSKLKSIKLLSEYFDIHYTERQLYHGLKKSAKLKELSESISIEHARKHLDFNFTVVFYDVTTLYFEAFEEDDLRKCGFSKDNKFNQPQVLIALIVDRNGYPVGYEIFEGNKFEGHTILPVILEFKKKYKIQNLTVVADAAMLSRNNLEELSNNDLKYIVGARLANLPIETIKSISGELNKQNGKIVSINSDNNFLLCDFSKKRASKDKSNREKQIHRAKLLLENPSKASKKSKYLKNILPNKYELNNDLIKKAELLEGIKGYCTNITKESPELLIARYKELWKIEKSFRIAKSDLKFRPVFHWKKAGIESHVIIVFISLSMAKYLELIAGLSIAVIKDLIWKVCDVQLYDPKTNQTFLKRTPIPDLLLPLQSKIPLCH